MVRHNWFMRWFTSALLCLLVGCTGGGNPRPTPLPSLNGRLLFPFIISSDPAAPAVTALGSTVKLVGNNFGKEPGTVTIVSKADSGKKLVTIGSDIVSWSDNEIIFKLPTRDANGNPLLSTDPLVGDDLLSVRRADGIENPTNSDFQGISRPVLVVSKSVGKAKVTIDKGGRNFAGESLEYKIVFGSGAALQTAATFTTSYTNEKSAVDLEHLFNELPARGDYQVIATLFAGPAALLQEKTVATGSILVESSPVPLHVNPAEETSAALPIPCTVYFICQGFSTTTSSSADSGSPQPTLAPGQSPTPTPVTTPTPTPTPTATPPAGVTPETVVNAGTISTIAGTGSNALPSSKQFNCTSTPIGCPWSTALDSQKVIHFAMNQRGLGRLTSGTTCDAIILSEQVGGKYLGQVLAFTFVGASDDLYIADTQFSGMPRWRVVEVKKAGATYDLSGATSLNFGGTLVEAPSGMDSYGGNKLYIASSDDAANGGGQSYIVEYDLTNKQTRIVAGNGTPGYAGDGGPATAAEISPIGVTVGPAGTPFDNLMVIADGGTNSLRAVNLKTSGDIDYHGQIIAPGNIATIAGKNSNRYANLLTAPLKDFNSYAFGTWQLDAGFSGDGGLATEAKLDWPYAPHFDKEGRLYFIDAGNHRIRVIDRSGIMHTLVGTIPVPANNGQRGFGSPGGKNPAKPYPPGAHTIANGDGGPGNEGDVNAPMDMTVTDESDGSVTLYIAETDSYRMRKVSGLRFQ